MSFLGGVQRGPQPIPAPFDPNRPNVSSLGNAPAWFNIPRSSGTTDGFGPVSNGAPIGNQAALGGDWRSAVSKFSNGMDPFEYLKQMVNTGGPVSHTFAGDSQSPNIKAIMDFRRQLLGSGLDPYTAGKIEEAFAGSGSGAEAAAHALGLDEQFKQAGNSFINKQTYSGAPTAGGTGGGNAGGTGNAGGNGGGWYDMSPQYSGLPTPPPPIMPNTAVRTSSVSQNGWNPNQNQFQARPAMNSMQNTNQPPSGWEVDPTRTGGVRPWDKDYQAAMGQRGNFDPTHGGTFYRPVTNPAVSPAAGNNPFAKNPWNFNWKG